MKKFLFTSIFLAATATLGWAAAPTPDLTELSFPEVDLKSVSNVIGATAADPIAELGKLSAECQAALFSIVANPEFFECVPIQAFLPLLPLLADPNAIPNLLKDPIHNLPPVLTPVFDGVCAAPKCSDAGVATSLKALEEGCKADKDNELIKIATVAIAFYSPIRDTICFKTNKGEYCVFDTLEKILTLPSPPVKILGGFIDKVAFAKPDAICTPCNKAILNTVVNFLDKDVNGSVEILSELGVPVGLLPLAKLGVALKCGFQFLDGNVGNPETTDPSDFDYQLSLNNQDSLRISGASSIKGGLMTVIGGFLVSSFFMI